MLITLVFCNANKCGVIGNNKICNHTHIIYLFLQIYKVFTKCDAKIK